MLADFRKMLGPKEKHRKEVIVSVCDVRKCYNYFSTSLRRKPAQVRRQPRDDVQAKLVSHGPLVGGEKH